MHIGYIVGIVVAVSTIICGCLGVAYAKKNNKKSKWAVLAIVLGIAALISVAINLY